MVGFGPKQAWLAIRDGDPSRLMALLGLRDLGSVPWRDGIDLAYLTDNRVAITPRLPGARGAAWTLVVGRWLLGVGVANPDIDVAALSAALGTEVQAFATYRVGELHRWERADDGTPVRAFEYVGSTGQVTRWQGEPDAAELAIGLPRTIAPEADILVSENEVLRLAGAWSIDPRTLDGQAAPGPLRAAAAD